MDLNFFNQKGYIVIKNQIDNQFLDKLRLSSRKILKNAVDSKWPFIRVYRDYPHFFGKPNIFGVDYPLNRFLSNDLFDLFKNINLENYINILGNFNNFETELIRLHTNSKFFKYQGGWHRDYKNFNSSGYLSCIIYLENEKGFKIVTKDKNKNLKKFGIDVNLQSNLTVNDSFISLPTEMYDVVNVRAGDILFFEPGLLHQGYCNKYRLHYHMRFKAINEKVDNQNKPFNFVKDLLPDADISEKNSTYNYSMNFFSRITRFRTLLLYFLPRIKSLINNFFSKKKN